MKNMAFGLSVIEVKSANGTFTFRNVLFKCGHEIELNTSDERKQKGIGEKEREWSFFMLQKMEHLYLPLIFSFFLAVIKPYLSR